MKVTITAQLHPKKQFMKPFKALEQWAQLKQLDKHN